MSDFWFYVETGKRRSVHIADGLKALVPDLSPAEQTPQGYQAIAEREEYIERMKSMVSSNGMERDIFLAELNYRQWLKRANALEVKS